MKLKNKHKHKHKATKHFARGWMVVCNGRTYLDRKQDFWDAKYGLKRRSLNYWWCAQNIPF